MLHGRNRPTSSRDRFDNRPNIAADEDGRGSICRSQDDDGSSGDGNNGNGRRILRPHTQPHLSPLSFVNKRLKLHDSDRDPETRHSQSWRGADGEGTGQHHDMAKHGHRRPEAYWDEKGECPGIKDQGDNGGRSQFSHPWADDRGPPPCPLSRDDGDRNDWQQCRLSHDHYGSKVLEMSGKEAQDDRYKKSCRPQNKNGWEDRHNNCRESERAVGSLSCNQQQSLDSFNEGYWRRGQRSCGRKQQNLQRPLPRSEDYQETWNGRPSQHVTESTLKNPFSGLEPWPSKDKIREPMAATPEPLLAPAPRGRGFLPVSGSKWPDPSPPLKSRAPRLSLGHRWCEGSESEKEEGEETDEEEKGQRPTSGATVPSCLDRWLVEKSSSSLEHRSAKKALSSLVSEEPSKASRDNLTCDRSVDFRGGAVSAKVANWPGGEVSLPMPDCLVPLSFTKSKGCDEPGATANRQNGPNCSSLSAEGHSLPLPHNSLEDKIRSRSGGTPLLSELSRPKPFRRRQVHDQPIDNGGAAVEARRPPDHDALLDGRTPSLAESASEREEAEVQAPGPFAPLPPIAPVAKESNAAELLPPAPPAPAPKTYGHKWKTAVFTSVHGPLVTYPSCPPQRRRDGVLPQDEDVLRPQFGSNQSQGQVAAAVKNKDCVRDSENNEGEETGNDQERPMMKAGDPLNLERRSVAVSSSSPEPPLTEKALSHAASGEPIEARGDRAERDRLVNSGEGAGATEEAYRTNRGVPAPAPDRFVLRSFTESEGHDRPGAAGDGQSGCDRSNVAAVSRSLLPTYNSGGDEIRSRARGARCPPDHNAFLDGCTPSMTKPASEREKAVTEAETPQPGPRPRPRRPDRNHQPFASPPPHRSPDKGKKSC